MRWSARPSFLSRHGPDRLTGAVALPLPAGSRPRKLRRIDADAANRSRADLPRFAAWRPLAFAGLWTLVGLAFLDFAGAAVDPIGHVRLHLILADSTAP